MCQDFKFIGFYFIVLNMYITLTNAYCIIYPSPTNIYLSKYYPSQLSISLVCLQEIYKIAMFLLQEDTEIQVYYFLFKQPAFLLLMNESILY
jgi:hypothetical protein